MKKRTLWEITKKFSQPVIIGRKVTVPFLILNLALSSILIVVIYSTKYIVEAIESGNTKVFLTWIGISAGLGILYYILQVFVKPKLFKFFSTMRGIIDGLYLKKILYGDNNKYEKVGTGKLMDIYSRGVLSREMMITDILRETFGTGIYFLVFFYSLIQQDSKFFFGIVAFLLFSVIWLSYTGDKTYFRRRQVKKVNIAVSRLQVKWFMSKFEIMQQDRVNDELQKKLTLNHERFLFKMKEKYYQGISYELVTTAAILLFVGSLLFLGNQALAGSIELSQFIVIVGLGGIFIKDLDSTLRIIRYKIIDRFIDVEKLRELAETLETDYNIDEGEQFIYKHGNIEIKNLSFSYGSGPAESVFNDFSLQIQGSQKTALVGLSGSGKSTLVKLISGYLRADQGKIVIDGQEITSVALKTYYKEIGYLTQEPSVFDGTIRENLFYGTDRAFSEQEIQSLLSLAQCDFVFELPGGLECEIGERGIRLSGGQRQRIAIAKILFKDPKIIILDEPTAALDSFSEEGVTQALNALFTGRTVIIIAHRLQTVKNADEIIVLDKGTIIERGTHASLSSAGGTYEKMVQLQATF